MSLGLATLTVAALCAAQLTGLVPDPQKQALQRRKELSESLAAQCAYAVAHDDDDGVHAAVQEAVRCHSELTAAAIRNEKHEIVTVYGSGDFQPADQFVNESTVTHIKIPVFRAGKPWGTIELQFPPLQAAGLWGLLNSSSVRLILFMTLCCVVLFMFYLRRMLQQLDPSAVIPDRVRAMLDALAEGTVVLDLEARIVFANRSFGTLVGESVSALQGRRIERMRWLAPDSDDALTEFPWRGSIADGKPRMTVALRLRNPDGKKLTISANCAPILGQKDKVRGALVTFDDLTTIEEKNTQLAEALGKLQHAHEQLAEKNVQLEHLATRDPMTGVLNRRAFFEEFARQWDRAQRYGSGLACVMVDIDHFKSVNDRFGHQVGDDVIKHVVNLLKKTKRTSDVIGRYGGEEFCVILPEQDIDSALAAANRFCRAVEATPCGDLSVTASFGVSAIERQAESVEAMIEQADQALYYSKENGRNQATAWSADLQAAASE